MEHPLILLFLMIFKNSCLWNVLSSPKFTDCVFDRYSQFGIYMPGVTAGYGRFSDLNVSDENFQIVYYMFKAI